MHGVFADRAGQESALPRLSKTGYRVDFTVHAPQSVP
jgi:hypothetical protein